MLLAEIRRYLKLLRLFWTAAIAAELEYRLNFLLAAIGSLGGAAGSVFGLFLFYRTGYQFQGWNWEEAVVVLGVFTLLQGISAFLLVPNLNRIVEQVQDGTLDFVLLKPADSQFWLSLRAVSPWGVPDMILGTAAIVWAGDRLGIGPLGYLTGALPLLCGVLILYSLWFILGATSIWFVKIYNVTEVLRGLLEAGRYPMAAYPMAYRLFFTFIVPVAFMTALPAEAFLGRGSWAMTAGSIGLASAALLTARGFWRFALRFYTSASS